MRIKQELKLPKSSHNLWINNKSIQEFQDIFPVESEGIISPETCTHRHQQGWRHLQDLPSQNIQNNNNNISITNNNNNINNNSDEADVLASSSSPQQIDGSSGDDDDVEDYQSQRSHDDDTDETSSGDEDSSISFSDTSPLLDVSSLDEDSTTSSDDSDDDDDTDMCDDDDDDGGIPHDGDPDDNVDDGFEDEDDHACSMDTSWMSISSAASVDVPSTSENRCHQVFDHRRDRNGVVLPDVLPISVSKASNEELTPDGVKKIVDATLRELTLRVKKRSELKLDAVPRLLARECCIVEITTQPDIQVDIRLNPASSAPGVPISEAHIRHGVTHPPRDAVHPGTVSKDSNCCIKAATEDSEFRATELQTSNSSSPRENQSSSRYVGLGEGVRLNNFSIVNGFKAVSLTELVKMDDDESLQVEPPPKREVTDQIPKQESLSIHAVKTEKINLSQTLPSKFPDYPSDVYSIHSKENKRHRRNSDALVQGHCVDTPTFHSMAPSQDQKSGDVDAYLKSAEPGLNHRIKSNALLSQSKIAPQVAKMNDVSSQTPTKIDGTLSSPELFEVYTMETTIPHLNWAAINKVNRESEWLKKRRNDREEIRRKLAMDSDNEDYVADKMVQNQDSSSSSIDRLKGSSNLQICFLNEGAKDPDTIPNADPSVESIVKKPLPKMLMSNLLFPPGLQKSTGNSKVQQNNNNSHSQVVKRQRPTFFFNRPRSWHAAKVEEKHDPEEDLFTRHHRLQTEAREALAQAKDMARMQMEIERQKKKKSPIAEIVGISFPDGQNSLSRHALLDMNVAQLQVIVNDLHSQIETLNENLVKFLLERDDLHMEQDSMLVDIEDLTRYLGLKGDSSVTHPADCKLPLNVQVSSSNKKMLNCEPVRRSQSVHLKKPRNFMWPLQRFSLLSRGSTSRG